MNIKTLIYTLGLGYGSSFLGFVQFFIMASLLSAAEYGWIAAGLAIGRVLSNAVELGSQRTFVRAAVRVDSDGDVGPLAQENLGARLSMLVICSLIILVYSVATTDSALTALSVFFASMWSLMFGMYPASWYDYARTTSKQAVFIFLERVVGVALCAVLFIVPEYLQLALIVSLPLFLARVYAVYWQIRYWLAVNHSTRPVIRLGSLLKPPLSVSYFVMAAMLGNSILTYGNQVVLTLTEHKDQLPGYSIAFQIVGLVTIFQGLAVRMLMREISEICRRKCDIRAIMLRHAAYISGISLVSGLAVWLASYYLVPYMFKGDGYQLTADYVFVLAFWVSIAGVGRVVTQYMLELGMDLVYLKTSILAGVVGLVAGTFFVPHWGADAVITILIITHLAMIVYNYSVMVKLPAFRVG